MQNICGWLHAVPVANQGIQALDRILSQLSDL